MNFPIIPTVHAGAIGPIRKIDHYTLDDGRIWSVAEAKFVTEVPEGGVPGPCPDEQGKNSLEGLKGCLDFYGYEKGALA
jgi:hypothetical protein